MNTNLTVESPANNKCALFLQWYSRPLQLRGGLSGPSRPGEESTLNYKAIQRSLLSEKREARARSLLPQAASRGLSWERALSRRMLLKTAVGAAAAYGLGLPGAAHAAAEGEPRPIPGGTPLLGGGFHVFAPGPPGSGLDPPDAEPNVITDFNGFVGMTYVDVPVTRTNRATGEVRRLPSIFSDMRFILGEYRGLDGKMHHGAFAFI